MSLNDIAREDQKKLGLLLQKETVYVSRFIQTL
jgi:hypothetical protein